MDSKTGDLFIWRHVLAEVLCWTDTFRYYPHVTLGRIFKIVARYNHALVWELTNLTEKLKFAIKKDATLGTKMQRYFLERPTFPLLCKGGRRSSVPSL